MWSPTRIGRVLPVLFLMSTAQAEDPMFNFEALPELGFSMSSAHEVMANDLVSVAGEVHNGQVWRPVLWSRNATWRLDELPVPTFAEGDARAFDLSHGLADQLWIVGEVCVDVAFSLPYLWKEEVPGEFTMVELPNNGEGAAHGIAMGTDAVAIVGWSAPGTGTARKGHDQGTYSCHALGQPVITEFLPSFGGELPSMAHDVMFIGDMPVVVGVATNASLFSVPILWTCDKGEWFMHELPLLPGGVEGEAHAISRPNGQRRVVGWGTDAAGARLPVRWVSDDGVDWQIQMLEPVVPGEIHDATNVNGNIYHVGNALSGQSTIAGLWITNGAFQFFDLNERIVGGPPPLMLQTAHGLAANGHVYIVGDGVLTGRQGGRLGVAPHAYVLEREITVDVPPVVASAIRPSVRAHPNPAGRRPSFAVFLPEDADVALTVHDPSGRLVAKVLETRLTAGDHTASWNGRDLSGQDVAPGVYFVHLRSGGEVVSSRVVIER